MPNPAQPLETGAGVQLVLGRQETGRAAKGTEVTWLDRKPFARSLCRFRTTLAGGAGGILTHQIDDLAAGTPDLNARYPIPFPLESDLGLASGG
ncbi:MAG TPA: hypothetical protein VHI52_19095 [Verrucomicrobiae bacterium]|nr:hypothetical protein [Verrucomicrobiae bacterium]